MIKRFYLFDKTKMFIATIFIVLFICSCAGVSKKTNLPKKTDDYRLTVNIPKPEDKPQSEIHKNEEVGNSSEKILGKDELIKSYSKTKDSGKTKIQTKSFLSDEKKLKIAVDDMASVEFIHYVFGEIFKMNYIIDSKIQNNKKIITLNLENEISEKELFTVVKDILSQNGIFIYEKKDIFYLSQKKRTENVSLGIGSNCSDVPNFTGKIKQIVPIHFTAAGNVLAFIPKTSDIRISLSSKGNMIIIEGFKDQVCNLLEIIEILDSPPLRGRHVSLLSIKNRNADEVIRKLKEILKVEGIPIGGKGVHFSDLSRWSAILCFAQEKTWLSRIKYWVELLDVPEEKEVKKYFIYRSENSKAVDLVETLQSLIGDGASPGKDKKLKIKNVSLNSGDIRLTAEKKGNSIIVYSTIEQYRQIEDLLKKIDIIPVQVMIEVMIAEVTLTDTLSYGLEWALKNSDSSQIIKTMGGLGLGGSGLVYSMTANSQKFQLALNAMAKQELLKVVSSPWLTVLDGVTATINVGTQVPVLSSEATSPDVQQDGDSSIIRSVQYRNTGVSLNVTPTVHSYNMVSLNINQVVSEAQINDTSNISSPVILDRSLTTEVIAKNGHAVILGGMIRENKSNSKSKVPILGSLPLIGNLFKTRTKGINRTELVVVITPHILNSTQETDDIKSHLIKGFNYLDFK